LCLVELRGSEPLTPCLPSMRPPRHAGQAAVGPGSRLKAARAQR
jgi:hypothetical protein